MPILIKIALASLVCVEVWPSHTTSAEPFSTVRAAVADPYLRAPPTSARVENRVEFV